MNLWAFFCAKITKHCKKAALKTSGLFQLFILFVIAAGLSGLISNHSVLADSLFQSPASPPAQPVQADEPPPPQPAQQAEPAPAQPTPPPAEPEAAEPAPSEPQEVEVVPDDPVDSAQPATESVSPVSPEQSQAGGDPASLTESAAPEQSLSGRERSRSALADPLEEEGSPNFILDRVELVDTIVVSTAYLWLCCGIGLFLFIPLAFLFLQIRGRTKISKEEIY